MHQQLEFWQKGYLPNTLITPEKLQGILNKVRKTLQVTNPDYDLVIDKLHIYYDMQLATSGIDKDRNLIIQFPIFVQLYIQQPLILYQLETVPVLILDQNDKAHSHTFTKQETIYCPKFRDLHLPRTTGIEDM